MAGGGQPWCKSPRVVVCRRCCLRLELSRYPGPTWPGPLSRWEPGPCALRASRKLGRGARAWVRGLTSPARLEYCLAWKRAMLLAHGGIAIWIHVSSAGRQLRAHAPSRVASADRTGRSPDRYPTASYSLVPAPRQARRCSGPAQPTALEADTGGSAGSRRRATSHAFPQKKPGGPREKKSYCGAPVLLATIRALAPAGTAAQSRTDSPTFCLRFAHRSSDRASAGIQQPSGPRLTPAAEGHL